MLNASELAVKIEPATTVTKILIDVSVSKPITVSIDSDRQPKLHEAIKTGLAAKMPFERKKSHYAPILGECNKSATEQMGIIPFIVQTSGFIHEKSLKLLEQLPDSASNIHQKPKEQLYYRYKKLIACSLQRGCC